MTATTDTLQRLTPLLGDRLLTPSHAGFGSATALALSHDRAPELVARPRTAAEVAEVVRAAADAGLPLAVRGGGHSYARFGVADGGLTLDTRLLDAVRVDVDARVATAGGGVTAGAYAAAASPSGLATGFGDTPSVGIAGLALGGGIGWLSRRDGLTLDNLLAAELVLSDGSVVRTDADAHPDLFWALRGGGGNFGVVTSLELRLSPLSPSDGDLVTGGIVAFEPSAETVARLLAAAAEAPDEVSLMINVMKAPPAPFLPAQRHGKPIVVALVCHSGAPDDADAALAPFRAVGAVLADTVRAQPYAAMFREEAPGAHATVRTGFGEGLNSERAAAAIELVGRAQSAVAVVNLRPMGGAVGRVPADETAFAHRSHPVMELVGAVDLPDAGPDRGREWVAETASVLGIGIGEAPGYVNFLAEPGDRAIRSAYPPATLARLREVKRIHDPGNLFRSNHNIEPAV